MKRKRCQRLIKWKPVDPAHLSRALNRTKEAKVYQRILALRLVAAGWSVSGTARFIHRSRQAIYHWLKRYGRRHRIADLQAAPRPGRPRQAPVLTEARILRELHRSPPGVGLCRTDLDRALIDLALAATLSVPGQPVDATAADETDRPGMETPALCLRGEGPVSGTKKSGPFSINYGRGHRARYCWSRTKPSCGFSRLCAAPGPGAVSRPRCPSPGATPDACCRAPSIWTPPIACSCATPTAGKPTLACFCAGYVAATGRARFGCCWTRTPATRPRPIDGSPGS
ncbi:MAG: transposase [Pedosphaera sp.]|nr:transposase [Pedosphaera sp.]